MKTFSEKTKFFIVVGLAIITSCNLKADSNNGLAISTKTTNPCNAKNCSFISMHMIQASVKPKDKYTCEFSIKVKFKSVSDIIVLSKDFCLFLIVSSENKSAKVDELGPPIPLFVSGNKKYELKSGEERIISFSASGMSHELLKKKLYLNLSIKNKCGCCDNIEVTIDSSAQE
jgi:hypothetical protein